MTKKVCVYCGSRFGQGSSYADLARHIGRTLVENGYDLVYGGGKVGLMGVVSDEVMRLGGHVTGVLPQDLFGREVGNENISDLRVVTSMHERKALMEQLSHGFLVLPGGWGTMDEFFEILTWAQIGIHQKPIFILNVDGFYDSLLKLVGDMVDRGFVQSDHLRLFSVASSLDELARVMRERL